MLVAKESAVVFAKGGRYNVRKNHTRIDESHPLAESHGHLFKPVDATFSVETTREQPPAPPAGVPADEASGQRPAKKAAAKKATGGK